MQPHGPLTVQSADGTKIAYEQTGTGPSLIVVGGAFATRHFASALITLLAERFTVCAYDRRGRGDSGDTPPHAVERELEDLDALIAAAGGSALVYGHSSGAALGLEAAIGGLAIDRLAVYEPPYMTAEDHAAQPPGDYAARIRAAVEAGRPEQAAEIFLEDLPPEVVAAVRESPDWPAMVAVAHTLPYDIAVLGDDGSIPAERLARITVPTLAIDGGASPAWARNAVAAIDDAIPSARRRTIEGQEHNVAPAAIAPVLIDFLG